MKKKGLELFTGTGPTICPKCHSSNCGCQKIEEKRPESTRQKEPIRISYQRMHKGSGLTRIERLPMNQAAMEELLKRYKKRLGVGGAVKGGTVELQGEHRTFIKADLESLGYSVRLMGS